MCSRHLGRLRLDIAKVPAFRYLGKVYSTALLLGETETSTCLTSIVISIPSKIYGLSSNLSIEIN